MPLRTGQQYLDGLRDGRNVLCDGRLIPDVTAEPGFRATARAIAEFYDVQNLPALREVMTYETEDGDRAGVAYIEPRSKEDLRRRTAAYTAWAEISCGLLGRSPDYMNACMMMVGAAAIHLGAKDPELGRRAHNLYLDARRRDLCLTHTFIPAHIDKKRPASEQAASLRVVRETEDGPVVSGARVVGTLAPFADANLAIYGGMLAPERDPGADSMAIAFMAPVGVPGMRWSCRDVLDTERGLYDAPLAGRADEQDALAIFDEVLVPWENVFIYRDVEIFNRQTRLYRFDESLGHQVLVKNIAKTRLLFGLAHLIAESKQINEFINVQERLGDFAVILANLEGLAIAAVEGAGQDPHNGLWYPNPRAVWAGLRLYPEYYPRLIDHLIQLGASDFVVMPPERSLDAFGAQAEELFAGATGNARGKVALFRLAWELCGSGWGGRQELYERFFFGDTTLMKAIGYAREDKTKPVAMVQRLLDGAATPDEPFPLPEEYRGA